MRQPAIFAITVRRGVAQTNFSRRKITLRYAAAEGAGRSACATEARTGRVGRGERDVARVCGAHT